MIKIQTIEIEEFRGIRALRLDLNGKNFAVCGRNGTGKSGIVDAIEFALTGNISRLSGEGTDKLSVKAHAPHVDSRDNPGNAHVRLTVTIPSLKNITVTVERSPAEPKKPKIDSTEPAVLNVLKQVEDHPELVLTRREIIRYVLATEGKRSEEVQAVLRLGYLTHIRATLQTIVNAKSRDVKTLRQPADASAAALRTALGITTISEAAVLSAVNARRKVLDLPAIDKVIPTTSLKEGIATPSGSAQANAIPKAAALADCSALDVAITQLRDSASDPDFNGALEACLRLSIDGDALKTLSREGFLESGLALVDDDSCPFCDHPWELEVLRNQVKHKLQALTDVRQKRAVAEQAVAPVGAILAKAVELITRISKYGEAAKLSLPSESLAQFRTSLERGRESLVEFLPLVRSTAVLQSPPLPTPSALKELEAITNSIKALPEPSATEAAKEYLVVGQERLDAYRTARRNLATAEAQEAVALAVSTSFATTADSELTLLYQTVEKEFASMYGELNSPDEADFAATLVPSIGKLGFDVNFYGRGFFPPGAYHSEGHQDAMGLCLYLALMENVLKNNFLFAVLDDVLMSVDAGHRRAVCMLLKMRFPNTQFILTTHDPIWLNHMRAEGLVTGRSIVHFRSWEVDTGPAVWNDTEVWGEIEKELKDDRVSVAAGLLRHFLEYIAGEACDRLHARVEFRLDGRMDLGALLPPACSQLTALYAKGKEAANSWNQKDAVQQLAERSNTFSASLAATGVDRWQMNAAIHYNAWASLQQEDFQPVVTAFRTLVSAFRCDGCGELLSVLREDHNDKALSCSCGKATVNLVPKAKA